VKQSHKYLQFFLIIALILFIGFFRETTFKSINALLQAWDADWDYDMPFYLDFLKSLDYDTIVNLKWLFTLIFSFFYLLICCYTVKVMFNSVLFKRITIGAYIFITVFSGIFIVIGMLIPHSSTKMYEFARYFMGIAQSPVILMILVPVFRLAEKEKNRTTTVN
jgi:hypothetical protein